MEKVCIKIINNRIQKDPVLQDIWQITKIANPVGSKNADDAAYMKQIAHNIKYFTYQIWELPVEILGDNNSRFWSKSVIDKNQECF